MGVIIVLVLFILLMIFCVVVLWGAPYVPSKPSDVARAFDELYQIGPDDLLVDIGSGDGLVLRAAARRGARAVGYELNPVLVLLSRWFNRRYGGVHVRLANYWRVTVPPRTTVIYTFGESRDIEKMADWAEHQATLLGHRLYFISYGFQLKRPALRSYQAHYLYQIDPLQPPEQTV